MYSTNIEIELKGIKNKTMNSSVLYDLNSNFFNDFELKLLKNENIFHVNDIKNTCIDYRLRFLNSKYFKGDIPKKAQIKLNNFKRKHRLNSLDMKIMAPSKLFKLKNSDDPLLFCNLGNEYYYLIDKWGSDLSYFRKISMWPFKSLKNILLFIAFLSLLVTLVVPNGIFVYDKSPNAQFFITFLFMLKSITAIVLFFGFSLGKNFNTTIWNRKYFN